MLPRERRPVSQPSWERNKSSDGKNSFGADSGKKAKNPKTTGHVSRKRFVETSKEENKNLENRNQRGKSVRTVENLNLLIVYVSSGNFPKLVNFLAAAGFSFVVYCCQQGVSFFFNLFCFT